MQRLVCNQSLTQQSCSVPCLALACAHPLHVLLVVAVERRVAPVLAPQDEVRVLDAMRRRARRLGQRAQREGHLRREEPEQAVKAWGLAGEDDAGMALEALGPTVHERLHALGLDATVWLEFCAGMRWLERLRCGAASAQVVHACR